MSDIFICYSRTDITIATQLMQRLQAAGWDVFIDKKTHVGRRWHEEIEKELHAAKAVVVLWSGNSRNSDYVLEEAEYGKRKDILFPAFIEQVEPPYGFSRIQTADLISWKGNPDHPGLIEILDALRLHLNSPTQSAAEIDSNTHAPEPVAQPIASSSVASELTDHDNLQTNAGTNNNQVPKKENNIVFVLGIAIILVAAWAFDKFLNQTDLNEVLSSKTESASNIVKQAEPPKMSLKQAKGVKDLVSNGLLPELVLIPAGSFDMGEQNQAFIKAMDDKGIKVMEWSPTPLTGINVPK